MSGKILIAEDELHIRKLISDYLTYEGMTVIEAKNGEEAVDLFSSTPNINLVILDIMMPVMNGREACESIRDLSPDVPILFLTALSDPKDEVEGLGLGADDYVTKPFRYEVLMARVKALLRRTGNVDNEKYKLWDCEIDTAQRSVKESGQLVDLSPKEFDLLIYFAKNQDIALERQQILDAVWGYDFFGDPRTIDTHVKNLRAKLPSVGEQLKSVRGFGYKLERDAHDT